MTVVSLAPPLLLILVARHYLLKAAKAGEKLARELQAAASGEDAAARREAERLETESYR